MTKPFFRIQTTNFFKGPLYPILFLFQLTVTWIIWKNNVSRQHFSSKTVLPFKNMFHACSPAFIVWFLDFFLDLFIVQWWLFIYQGHLLRGFLELCIWPPALITLGAFFNLLNWVNQPGGENGPLPLYTLSQASGLHCHEGYRVYPYFHMNPVVKSHCAEPAEVQFESLRFLSFSIATTVPDHNM